MRIENSTCIKWFVETTKTLIFYSSLTLIPTGILLNFFTILIFSRKKFAKNTMGFYYTIVAFTDIIALIMVFFHMFGISIDYNFTEISSFWCKMIPYWTRVFINMSSGIKVLITIDRLICIKYYNRKAAFALKNKRTILFLMVLIFLFFCLINMPNLFYSVVDLKKTASPFNQIMFKCIAPNRISLPRDVLFNLFSSVIPFLFMIIANSILIKILIKSKQKFKKDLSLKSEYQFAFSLIFVNLFFLLTMIPIGVTTLFYYVYLKAHEGTSPLFYKATLYVFVSAFILLLNFTLQFLIHLLFNKLFQKEIISILRNFNVFKRIISWLQIDLNSSNIENV